MDWLKSGVCWQCGTRCYELGTPQAEWSGRRVGFLLADGSHMDLTMCEACAADPDLELLWWRVLDGWDRTPAYVARQLRQNCILGVLYALPWTLVEPVLARKMSEHG